MTIDFGRISLYMDLVYDVKVSKGIIENSYKADAGPTTWFSQQVVLDQVIIRQASEIAYNVFERLGSFTGKSQAEFVSELRDGTKEVMKGLAQKRMKLEQEIWSLIGEPERKQCMDDIFAYLQKHQYMPNRDDFDQFIERKWGYPAYLTYNLGDCLLETAKKLDDLRTEENNAFMTVYQPIIDKIQLQVQKFLYSPLRPAQPERKES